MGIRALGNPAVSYAAKWLQTGKGAEGTNVPPLEGHTATGGTTTEYTDPVGNWKAHKFTSPGTFTISALGEYGNNVEYMAIGGGGAGGGGPGRDRSGGGGAGAIRTSSSWPVTTTSYPVSIGPG